MNGIHGEVMTYIEVTNPASSRLVKVNKRRNRVRVSVAQAPGRAVIQTLTPGIGNLALESMQASYFELCLQPVVFCASVIKHRVRGAYHWIRQCPATRRPHQNPINVLHLRRSDLIVIPCCERLMNGVGSHVADCGEHMLSELTLYIQVPIHGVGAVGMWFRKRDLG